MFCHKCGSSLAHDAIFCSRCGARVPAASEAPAAPAPYAQPAQPAQAMPAPAPAVMPAAPVITAAPAAVQAMPPSPMPLAAGLAVEAQYAARAGTAAADPRLEREVWTGSYSTRALAPAYMALGGWTILMIVIASLVKGGPWWLWFLLIAIPAVYVGGRLLYYKWTIRYRLTTQRFFHTYGLFVQRTDETELLRIDDVTLEQTIIERMVDVGTLVIESTDKSEPKKYVRGIANPREVKEHVRSYAQQLRQGVGVMRVHSV
jgi:uncharacterized membrane protein YdbT with pleckstrin-like domain